MDELEKGINLDPYDVESRVESIHWWFVVRRKLLKFILSSLNLPKDCPTIDIGCGVGSNLKVLISEGLYAIGLDQSTYALMLVRKKGKFPLVAGDLTKLPIKTKSVGLIIAMDVVEHLENDLKGIRELYRILKDNGTLVLTVPAFKSLWGIQDVVTGHRRRYSLKEISNTLKQSGFNIVRSSYFNFFLFFPILLGRRIIRFLRLKVKSENEVNFPLLNFFLKIIFSIETKMLKYFPPPFGVSILCVARKMGANRSE